MSTYELWLPNGEGSKEFYIPRARLFPMPKKPSGNPRPVREVDAAVHVVLNPDYSGSATDFGLDIIDWGFLFRAHRLSRLENDCDAPRTHLESRTRRRRRDGHGAAGHPPQTPRRLPA